MARSRPSRVVCNLLAFRIAGGRIHLVRALAWCTDRVVEQADLRSSAAACLQQCGVRQLAERAGPVAGAPGLASQYSRRRRAHLLSPEHGALVFPAGMAARGP